MEKQFVQPSYPIPETDLGGLTISRQVAQLTEFRNWVNSLELSTKGTRIDRYLQWLRQVESIGCVVRGKRRRRV